MQWMAVTLLVACHALHVPHVAVLFSEQLNHMISSALSVERVLHIWTRHIQTHRFYFGSELPFPISIAGQLKFSIYPFLGFV